jgi:hypothetical protein
MIWANRRGASLPEAMVSTFFAVLFAAMMHQFNRAVLRAVRVQEELGGVQQAARVVTEMIVHELRLAGYSGAGSPLARLRIAAPQEIEFQADLNGDGDTDDSSEIIGYRYDKVRGAVMRATGGTSPQPLLDHIAPDGFRLRYRDDNGADVAGDLSAAQRDRIRLVEITLAATYPNPDPAQPGSRVLTHTVFAELRNHSP